MALAINLHALLFVLAAVDSYKLNVPKVLLPFYSSQLISFQLELRTELNDPENLCFTWSSSMIDIVTIQPLYEIDNCSTKAIVTAVTKHPQRLSSIILAKETSKIPAIWYIFEG
jgi:hypothetical protein